MATTLFHWTLHPWAIYAVVGLAIAYSTFRRSRRQTISAVFVPLIGEKHAYGPRPRHRHPRHLRDALRLGRVAGPRRAPDRQRDHRAELARQRQHRAARRHHRRPDPGVRGLRRLRRREGHPVALQHQHGAGRCSACSCSSSARPSSSSTCCPPPSRAYFGDLAATRGPHRGQRRPGRRRLAGSWTVFYWAWWISWTPFVGMFIARISRGRTIRQFVGGVILVPSTVSLIWFAIFGGSAIRLQERQGHSPRRRRPRASSSRCSRLPDRHRHQPAGDDPRGIFFVSGADAASIVMGPSPRRATSSPAST